MVSGVVVVVFWGVEIATMVVRVQDFKHGNKKCKMVSYIENVFKCKNKGDFKNRAVFSNNIFFLFTLALLMTLASTAESPSYAIMVSTPFRLLVRLFGLHYVCLLLRSRPSSFLETPLSFLPLKLLHLRLHLRQYSSLAQRGRRQDSV